MKRITSCPEILANEAKSSKELEDAPVSRLPVSPAKKKLTSKA
jgi:hypothetical protein